MSGRNVARLPKAAKTTAKTTTASHCRRLHTASASSNAEPFCAESGMALSAPRASLGHDHDVAGLKGEVPVRRVAGHDLVVVERDPLHGGPLGADDEDSCAGCQVGEGASPGQNIQHRGPALELVPARGLDVADPRELEALDFPDQ